MEPKINPEVYRAHDLSLVTQALFDNSFNNYAITLASLINPESENSLINVIGREKNAIKPETPEFEDFCKRVMINGLVKAAFIVADTENTRIARDKLVLPYYRQRAELLGIGYYEGRALVDGEVEALSIAPILKATKPNPLKEKGWPKRLADLKSGITLKDLTMGAYIDGVGYQKN